MSTLEFVILFVSLLSMLISVAALIAVFIVRRRAWAVLDRAQSIAKNAREHPQLRAERGGAD